MRLSSRSLHGPFRRSFATKLEAPSRVAKPLVPELLHTAAAFQSLPPIKCLASLAEVTSTALADGKMHELLGSPEFVKLLQRVEARLYGFSATEAYLLVASIVRLHANAKAVPSASDLPSLKASRQLLHSALEQLADDWEALDGLQLAHLAKLFGSLDSYSLAKVDVEGFHQALRRSAESEKMPASGLVLALGALPHFAQLCPEPLVESLADAAVRSQRLSPSQLCSLSLSLAQLGQDQASSYVAQQLPEVAESLSATSLGLALEAVVLSGRLELLHPLQQRALSIAHTFQAPDAIRILRSMAAVGQWSAELTWLLLLQVAKVPRSSLAEEEERSLHQVMLSLLHDPDAAHAAKSIRSAEDLWEACYRPEDVGLESSPASSALSPELLGSLQVSPGLSVNQAMSLAGFYVLPLVLSSGDGASAAMDFDPGSPRWLPEEHSPTTLFRRLKERHLALWQLPLVWLRTSPADLESHELGAGLRRAEVTLIRSGAVGT